MQLRLQEAKKIADRRKLMEFTSITDIMNIKGVGPGSRGKIKEYIARQECSQIELFDIQNMGSSRVQDEGKSSKPPKGVRKKRNTKAQPAEKEIPVQAQLVS